MKPIKFEESNKVYTAPEGMPECQDLDTFVDGEKIISCWEMTAEEKISALFYGRVWLCVYGNGHPVVSLWASQSVFQYDDDLDVDWQKERETALDAFIERKANQFLEKHCSAIPKPNAMQVNYLSMFLKFALGIEIVDESKENV